MYFSGLLSTGRGLLFVLCLSIVAGSASHGATYPRLEAAFTLSGLATDPYDYAVTDVKVEFRLPDTSTLLIPAFFDGGTTWRVRYAPRSSGRHQIANITLNGVAAAYSGLSVTNWFVTGPATGPGYIRVDPVEPRRFITDDGQRYLPLGHNVAWNPTVSNDFPRIFQRMGAAGENWTRIWMTHFYESINLDWPKVDNALGKLNLTVARRWDLIVDEAEKAGIAMQMVFQHHGQYSTNVNPNWNENPYNTANGGFLSDATQFFTNSYAKALTKRKMRYAIARWGYSPSIMAWELWNEVQFTAASYANQWTDIAAWHDEMAAFLRSQDPFGHLVTTSSDLTKDYWDSMDYYQNHNYASDMVGSSRNAVAPSPSWPAKPNFDGESGSTYNVPRLWPQPLLWAGLMSGQAGTSCPWWWDTIDPQNEYFLFKSASDYVSLSGISDQDNLLRSAPMVSGVPVSALSFAPGGYWGPVTEDLFLVEGGAPDGITSATRYLHGYWHQVNMGMTNGYRFLVDYPQSGSFAVQVLETSVSGNSNLRILLDGVLKTNVSFTAANGGSTNVTFSVMVPAGVHTIALTNAAADWLVLGDITLNPYVPELGAYAVGNTNFQSAWLWHRTNLYLTSASATLSGTVAVKNLEAGTYSASWWDSYNGGTLSNFTLVVPSNGATVSIPTPAILRSAALTVGKPAQAALSGPDLTHVLASNAPALYTSLALTNGGGLPMRYSLSLTGLNIVAYTALNSTQSGGPAYRWRDVSAFGRDISYATNFTALAAPKNARDEGVAGPFQIGFEFPFFNGSQSPSVRTQVYVSPNGFITFTPFSGDRAANQTLPNASAPTNLVALFWDDLDLSTGGKVWVASDPLAGEFTVQYDAVRFKGSSSTVTAQLVLRSTGEILGYYKAIGVTNSCTVGVQNAAATQGAQITYNSSAYLRSGMALRISPAGWIEFDHAAGFVGGAQSKDLNLAFRPTSLTNGSYTASLVITTSDPLQPIFVRPVSLGISTDIPAAPSALTANAISANKVILTWTDNALNETGFEVQRRVGTNGAFALIGGSSPNAAIFEDLIVSPLAVYYYRVRATNIAGLSQFSDLASATTPTAPVASNDVTNTLEDVSVVIKVLANDFDPEGAPLSIVAMSTTNGIVSLSGTNLVFTPTTNYFGSVMLGYTISDGTNQASASVSVAVASVNDAPIAASDGFGLVQGATLSVLAPGLLANDFDVEAQLLSALLVTPVSHGSLLLNSNGGFSYTPATDFSGSDSFTYRVSDGGAASAPVTVLLTVDPLPPIQWWRLVYFGTTNNAGLAADDADEDGDGLLNIFEYGLNTNPTNANPNPLAYGIVGDEFHVYFPRKHPPPPDITYIYKVSDNLLSPAWNSGPQYTSAAVWDNLNGTETVTVRVIGNVNTNSSRFFRLLLSQP